MIIVEFLRRGRLFDRVECKNCIFRGIRYCWNECPYDIWRSP
jgi:hypothetical protein